MMSKLIKFVSPVVCTAAYQNKWQKFNTSRRCILEKMGLFRGHWKALAEGWKRGLVKSL